MGEREAERVERVPQVARTHEGGTQEATPWEVPRAADTRVPSAA